MKFIPSISIVFFLLISVNGSGQGILINEIMSSNISSIPDVYLPDYTNCPVPDCESWYEELGDLTMDGDYPDWIELYNPGGSPVNLEGYGLSDNPNDAFKWIFPSIKIEAKSYLVVFATGLNVKETTVHQYLHANFNIDRQTETIILSNPTGQLLSKVNTQNIPIDMSIGRNPKNESQWVFFTSPTPGYGNNSPVFTGFTNNVNMSQNSGFYRSGFELSLHSVLSNETIYYTLDGSNPSTNSFIYKNPIPINKTTVVKAQTFKDAIISSKIATETYFINEKSSLPVISLISPPENLWDNEMGIYTAGENANEGNRVANYWKDWERPCTVQYFDKNGNNAFKAELGMKIFGWGSRANDRKSISLFARNKYGDDEIDYPLFSKTKLDQFQSVVLRASGSDWQGTLFRDPMISSLVEQKDIDAQQTEPAILFINGEYWGIYNLREKLNEDYLVAHHNINKENVDIISQYWRRDYPIVIEGDDEEFSSLINFIETNNIETEENYSYIESKIDIDNFVNYQVAEIYAANYDWPGNNSKCWKEKTEDSKWRWMLFDLDYTFGSTSQNNYQHNTLEHATTNNNNSWPNPPNTTFLLRELLQNTTFKNLFINRFADLLNTIFLPDVVEDRIADFEEIYLPEIDKHIKRWGINNNKKASKAEWQENIDVLRTFAEERPANIREHIENYFGLSGEVLLKLNMNLVNSGSIKVNSIQIDDLNWEGIYFKDVPIKLSAIPKPGYRFASWDGVNGTDKYNPVITINLSGNTNIAANFESDENAINSIIISEIFFNSDNQNESDWIEIKNSYSVPIDLSGWLLKDKDFSHRYKFPEGSVINPQEYLVLCRDQNSFKQLFPNVSNTAGNFNFGLDSDADLVVLLNENQQVIDSVPYSNQSPWPTVFQGSSISLIAPELDNSMGQHWYSGINDISPGRANGIWTEISVSIENKMTNQSFPNPFRKTVTIQFSLDRQEFVQLKILNSSGQVVSTLCHQGLSEGQHQFQWNIENQDQKILPGIYLYTIQTESNCISGKMMKIE